MQLGSVEYYKDMHKKALDTITEASILSRMKFLSIDKEEFKKEFEGDTDKFHSFCMSYIKTLVPGRVTSPIYSVVVSVMASIYGKDHKTYAGYCLIKDFRFEAEKKKYEDGGQKLVNHVYTEVDSKSYDYFKDSFNLEVVHVDCERIDV